MQAGKITWAGRLASFWLRRFSRTCSLFGRRGVSESTGAGLQLRGDGQGLFARARKVFWLVSLLVLDIVLGSGPALISLQAPPKKLKLSSAVFHDVFDGLGRLREGHAPGPVAAALTVTETS
jgi:hypothetical protein